MSKTNFSQAGFTIIETFVAITILLIAVLMPLGVMSRAIEDGLFIKNRVTAFYLAQEGMELTINKVANNIKLYGAEGWLDDLADCTSSEGCTIENSEGTIVTDPCSNECVTIGQNIETGLFNYSPDSSATIFTRSVSLGSIVYNVDLDSDMVVPVTVTITWRNKANLPAQKLVINDFVYNTILSN